MCVRLPLFLAIPVLAFGPAQAQLAEVICDDTGRLEMQIEGMDQRRKSAQALRGPDTIVEVWIAPKTGDWTLVQTYANGTSCIVAMGEHWETLVPEEDPA